MDRDRFENLEAHVVSLVEAFARVKEENQRLHQDITQLQAALHAQQKEMESFRPEREELHASANAYAGFPQGAGCYPAKT